MIFPRINAAINATLLYYEVPQISSGVNYLSGQFTRAKVTYDNGTKEMPSWDELILLSHVGLEEEIQQIISLNYPHVQAMVLENLREIISNPPLDKVQKELIRERLVAYNKSEDERLLTQHPGGFSLGADLNFLPQYFIVVDTAINNLKRIINKYLKMYDEGKLPVSYQLPNYLPPNPTQFVKEPPCKTKLELKLDPKQTAILFRMLHDEGIIQTANKSEIFRFVCENFSLTDAQLLQSSFSNNFYKADTKAQSFWSTIFRKWVEGVKKISQKKPS